MEGTTRHSFATWVVAAALLLAGCAHAEPPGATSAGDAGFYCAGFIPHEVATMPCDALRLGARYCDGTDGYVCDACGMDGGCPSGVTYCWRVDSMCAPPPDAGTPTDADTPIDAGMLDCQGHALPWQPSAACDAANVGAVECHPGMGLQCRDCASPPGSCRGDIDYCWSFFFDGPCGDSGAP